MEELDKILQGESGEEEIETPKEPSEDKPEEEKKQEEEVQKKQEQLDNLNKAILEANTQIKNLRTEKKGIKAEEEIPKIDFEDPSSKAWDNHIKENVNPIQQELDKEKEEIRSFALKEFLADKPALSADPEKLKELVGTYEKIKTASERTREGVMLDLNKAFAAVYHDELLASARDNRVERAKGDILFSDPGVSRGATSYSMEKEASPEKGLSEDDKAVLAKWGMSPNEWGEAAKKYK